MSEFITGAILSGFLWDMAKIGTRKFMFKPMVDAFKLLEEKNENLDYTPIMNITFDDIQIHFYGMNRGFFTGVNDVFYIFLTKYEEIANLSEMDIYGIHIPVYKFSKNNDNDFYSLAPHKKAMRGDYTKFWGISYFLDDERNVLDVKKMSLLNENWKDDKNYF